MRIGGESQHKRALKVWEKREFKNLDNTRELGTRNIKMAMRRLRRFARDGAADELDLDATIEGTAKQGWLDIHMRPERHNAVKLLLFLDVGGSMDPFIKLVEELFSAATAEFKNLEFFYFHNCLYEGVWKDNRRRWAERTKTWDLLHKYGHDYKIVFVGDAAMSPYEITHPGGSVEHMNEEAGATWMQRVVNTYPATVWLNPVPEQQWGYSQSTKVIKQLVERPDVSAHPRRARRSDARVEPQAGLSYIRAQGDSAMRLAILPLAAAMTVSAMLPELPLPASTNCRDRIERVRAELGQPTLDRGTASADKPLLIAAVDKRIDGCAVMQMKGDVNDLRPLPRPAPNAALQPAR